MRAAPLLSRFPLVQRAVPASRGVTRHIPGAGELSWRGSAGCDLGPVLLCLPFLQGSAWHLRCPETWGAEELEQEPRLPGFGGKQPAGAGAERTSPASGAESACACPGERGLVWVGVAG